MANSGEISGELSAFETTGIYRLAGSSAAFVDPVRLLGDSYRRFRLSPSAYYSRRFASSRHGDAEEAQPDTKRKRKRKAKPRDLNDVERIAEARHEEARSLLLSAHESLLKAKDLLGFLLRMIEGEACRVDEGSSSEKNFVELGSSWRAPFCEMSLCFQTPNDGDDGEGSRHHIRRTAALLFNRLINVEGDDDVEGEFQNRHYILPRGSCFLMTDFGQVRDLIPSMCHCDNSDQGYNLIVIDPPWENGSVRQKVVYPTLPNRYLLYLPVQELAHTAGALVVLWITNREKLRMFVEKELFPSWGVKDPTVFYWLKVKPDGALIGDLDLFHHRPYECLLLGYINVNEETQRLSKFKFFKNSQVVMSIPGAHSRKPPLEKLLLEYVPGPKPAKCIELFARDLVAGWTSWGNEPLRFQDSMYFLER